MSTKELIQAELDALTEDELDTLYAVIKEFIESKREGKPRSLMATLKRIKIDGPPDFAADFDLYASGEKCDEQNIH